MVHLNLDYKTLKINHYEWVMIKKKNKKICDFRDQFEIWYLSALIILMLYQDVCIVAISPWCFQSCTDQQRIYRFGKLAPLGQFLTILPRRRSHMSQGLILKTSETWKWPNQENMSKIFEFCLKLSVHHKLQWRNPWLREMEREIILVEEKKRKFLFFFFFFSSERSG